MPQKFYWDEIFTGWLLSVTLAMKHSFDVRNNTECPVIAGDWWDNRLHRKPATYAEY